MYPQAALLSCVVHSAAKHLATLLVLINPNTIKDDGEIRAPASHNLSKQSANEEWHSPYAVQDRKEAGLERVPEHGPPALGHPPQARHLRLLIKQALNLLTNRCLGCSCIRYLPLAAKRLRSRQHGPRRCNPQPQAMCNLSTQKACPLSPVRVCGGYSCLVSGLPLLVLVCSWVEAQLFLFFS